MDCQEYIERFLSADVDGELSAEEASAVSQHLAGCPNCATRLASEREFKAFLRKRVPITSAPDDVRRRIVAELDRSASPSFADRIRALTPVLRWAPAAIAAVLIVMVVLSRFSQTPAVPAFDEAIASFTAFQGKFVPNVSANPSLALGQPGHHYDEWIREQIGVSVSAWNFDKLGYRFVGGRADRSWDGRAVVYTLYKGPNGQIVCAFQRFANFPVPPGGQTVNRVHHFYRYKGMSVCLTIEGDMVCILTCRMPLDDFIHAIKQVES